MARVVTPCRHKASAAVTAQGFVPNNKPTPVVTAIANAPQNATLMAPTVRGAPPACAANPPSSASEHKRSPCHHWNQARFRRNFGYDKRQGTPCGELAAEVNAA